MKSGEVIQLTTSVLTVVLLMFNILRSCQSLKQSKRNSADIQTILSRSSEDID